MVHLRRLAAVYGLLSAVCGTLAAYGFAFEPRAHAIVIIARFAFPLFAVAAAACAAIVAFREPTE